jgi:tetratricopeptide (TPR) repeat protein
MNTVEYEGQKFSKRKGIWYDPSFMAAPINVQKKLNTLAVSQIDYDTMTLQQIIDIANGFKASESYGLALKAYDKALEKSDIDKVKYVLPLITSCYRAINKPEKALEVYNRAKQEYGNPIIKPVLLTSVAAAYCDINEYEKAKECCDRAFAMSGGRGSGELMLVYSRIKSNM